MRIVFYYDVASPLTYLAAVRLTALAERARVSIDWQPVSWPADASTKVSAPHEAYSHLDLQRLAAFYNIPLHLPKGVVDSSAAMRLCTAAPAGARPALARVLFESVFVKHRDIANRQTLAAICKECRVDATLVQAVDKAEVQEALRANIQHAVDDDVFELPAVVLVEGKERTLFTGLDRLRLLAKMFNVADDVVVRTRFVEKKEPETVAFYFDYVSPYAYIASTQLEAIAARHNAKVAWKPIFLGGLRKNLGLGVTPPLETFSRQKRSYVMRDMGDWADYFTVPWHWPSRFPMNTVLALRLALAVDQAHIAAYSHAMFRAYWQQDRDISQPDVVRDVARHVGIDNATVERACDKDPALKAALMEATDQAQKVGVFGTPTVQVRKHLFWGQDRLPMVERALAGWDPPC